GGVSTDFYQDFRDERIAAGSVSISRYSQNHITFNENNYDLRAILHHYFKGNFDISGLIGLARRDVHTRNNFTETQGGLNIPNLYTLENSIERPNISNYTSRFRQNSLYASVSFGYRGMLYLDATGRNEWSSSLPQK